MDRQSLFLVATLFVLANTRLGCANDTSLRPTPTYFWRHDKASAPAAAAPRLSSAHSNDSAAHWPGPTREGHAYPTSPISRITNEESQTDDKSAKPKEAPEKNENPKEDGPKTAEPDKPSTPANDDEEAESSSGCSAN